MNRDVIIRKFQAADYDAVINIWKNSNLPYKPEGRDTRERILEEITKETAHFLVAEYEKTVVGTVLATHDGRKGWINRLAVTDEFKYRGLARELLERAEKALFDAGILLIACLIEGDNPMSMKFFTHAGYEKKTDIFYFVKKPSPEV